MNSFFVAILMGSDSDLNVMQHCADQLKALGIQYEINILSAHRTPEATASYVREAETRGCQVFIAAAGLAAHLAGAVAAQTTKPVIGVPLDAGSLGGFDSLLSTVQMPGGIPVATVAIDKPGAKNAAFLAAQILALRDEQLSQKLKTARADNAAAVLKKNLTLKETVSA